MSTPENKPGPPEVLVYISDRLAAGVPEAEIDAFVDGLPLSLTVDEVAPLLRVGRDAIYAGIKAGTFPHHRIGDRSLRVSREALRWMLKGASAADYQAMMLRLAEELRRRESGLPLVEGSRNGE